jgi:DNA-binding transcriptional MerR regulator
MLTISQLAKRFGLSRSTLLYYDSIGLLSPSRRSEANYRLYSQADVDRMELIDVYRQAGLPLADIARILSADESVLTELLAARLRALNQDIQERRRQQKMIVGLLKNDLALRETRSMDKDGWIAILRATGLSEEDMRRWHVEFERLSPEAHQDFLESLGIGDHEIAHIRGWSKARPKTRTGERGRRSPKTLGRTRP